MKLRLVVIDVVNARLPKRRRRSHIRLPTRPLLTDAWLVPAVLRRAVCDAGARQRALRRPSVSLLQQLPHAAELLQQMHVDSVRPAIMHCLCLDCQLSAHLGPAIFEPSSMFDCNVRCPSGVYYQ